MQFISAHRSGDLPRRPSPSKGDRLFEVQAVSVRGLLTILAMWVVFCVGWAVAALFAKLRKALKG